MSPSSSAFSRHLLPFSSTVITFYGIRLLMATPSSDPLSCPSICLRPHLVHEPPTAAAITAPPACLHPTHLTLGYVATSQASTMLRADNSASERFIMCMTWTRVFVFLDSRLRLYFRLPFSTFTYSMTDIVAKMWSFFVPHPHPPSRRFHCYCNPEDTSH
ncbi:hypothetical protein BDY19DRAFT_776302 [Irpex rosettiformis]|uniref:Uncharacterized protein n=1 Tax=Irpex rosettiformis TaxID=378272 RepID=A0ACB8TMF3_9APHY|nr:hypothetical protein BDY19DRAFT_776302 [Irpex rosettiformis]